MITPTFLTQKSLNISLYISFIVYIVISFIVFISPILIYIYVLTPILWLDLLITKQAPKDLFFSLYS